MAIATVVVGARVPEKLAKDFERVAKDHDRSFSAELRRVMRAHIEQHTASAKANGKVAAS